MMKVLFIYNDVNSTKGVADAHRAKSRFQKQNKDVDIQLTPVSRVNNIEMISTYDKIYIDESISTFVESKNYTKLFEFSTYNENSFSEKDSANE